MKFKLTLAAGALVALALFASASRPASAGVAKLVLHSVISLDAKNETVTLPLFKGRTADGNSKQMQRHAV